MFEDLPAEKLDKRQVRVYPIWLFQVIQDALSNHPLVSLATSQTAQFDVLTITTTDRRTLNIEVVAHRPLREIPDATGVLMRSMVMSLRRMDPLVIYDPHQPVRTIGAVECPICHQRAGRDAADEDGVLTMWSIDHKADCSWHIASMMLIDEVDDA